MFRKPWKTPATWKLRPLRKGLLSWSGTVYNTGNNEWASPATFQAWMTPARLAAARVAGFDWLRFHMGYNNVYNQAASTKAARIQAFIDNMAWIESQGFAVVLGWEISNAGGGALYDGVNGTAWDQVCRDSGHLAGRLHALRKPHTMANEPINEPNSVPGGVYTPSTLRLNKQIRGNAPSTVIFTSPDNYQGWNYVSSMSPTLIIDAQTGLAFHHYVEPVSQEGVGSVGSGWHLAFQNIEFPPNPATKVAERAAVQTRFTTYSVPAGEQAGLLAEFDSYHNTPRDVAYFNSTIDNVASALPALGLTPARTILSEFGALGDSGPNATPANTLGLPRTSRITLMSTVRARCEYNGFGWGYHQWWGYAGTDMPYNAGIMDSSTNTFDAGLLAALIP